jgi:hypothetical protein
MYKSFAETIEFNYATVQTILGIKKTKIAGKIKLSLF